jgi:hypothetical protein
VGRWSGGGQWKRAWRCSTAWSATSLDYAGCCLPQRPAYLTLHGPKQLYCAVLDPSLPTGTAVVEEHCMPPVQYPAHARASEIIPPGLCTPHDRSGRSLLQWLPTEWSVCPIECGARCTQHRDYQCRCIYFIEQGSWDLAKRFSEDICTRSIRSHGGVARLLRTRLHGRMARSDSTRGHRLACSG